MKAFLSSVRYGLQTISYMAPKIWNLVPKEMKQVTTLNKFKAKMKISANSVELTFRRQASLHNAF